MDRLPWSGSGTVSGNWRPARVEVDTETLPKNMDIGNGTRVVTLGKGAVGHLDFTALTQRRALVNVTTANGKSCRKDRP